MARKLKHHSHRLTTSGYVVANPRISTFNYRSLKDNTPASVRIYCGLVTHGPQDEWLDNDRRSYCRWHLDGQAIKHDFGDLDLSRRGDSYDDDSYSILGIPVIKRSSK